MKLEDLYQSLQERYPVEQEKKRLAEQKFKEEVRKGILAIVDSARFVIEGYQDELYEAYEKIQNDIKAYSCEKNDKKVYVLFRFENDAVRPFVCINDFDRACVGYFSLKSNVETHLNNLLSKYGSDTYLEIKFNDELVFDLKDSFISISIFAERKANGVFDNEEVNIIKKFILDVKEMFPNAEEIPEPDESKTFHTYNLTITFNCLGTDINDLFRTEEEKLLTSHISTLNLKTRTYNALIRNNFLTIESLIELVKEECTNYYEFIGPKTIEEVKQKLQELGVSF